MKNEGNEVSKLLKLYIEQNDYRFGSSNFTCEAQKILLSMDCSSLKRSFDLHCASLRLHEVHHGKFGGFLEFVRAVFWAIPSKNEEGINLRKEIFSMCIDALAHSFISDGLNESLVAILMQEICHLEPRQIPSVIKDVLAVISKLCSHNFEGNGCVDGSICCHTCIVWPSNHIHCISTVFNGTPTPFIVAA
jgi:hypothetical protein